MARRPCSWRTLGRNPVNQLIMMNISKHAAGYLYAYANLDGDWRFADRTLFEGAKEAAKKRFSLASFRQMYRWTLIPVLSEEMPISWNSDPAGTLGSHPGMRSHVGLKHVDLARHVGRGRQQTQPVNRRNRRVRKRKLGVRAEPWGLSAHPREAASPTGEVGSRKYL